jgi:hypothetical protein
MPMKIEHRDRGEDHEQRGLGSPDHAGEHVEAADRGAEEVGGARRLLRAEVHAVHGLLRPGTAR